MKLKMQKRDREIQDRGDTDDKRFRDTVNGTRKFGRVSHRNIREETMRIG